jgi:hypothetical protein
LLTWSPHGSGLAWTRYAEYFHNWEVESPAMLLNKVRCTPPERLNVLYKYLYYQLV